MPIDAEAVLEQTLRRADRLYLGGRGRLRSALKDAEQLLAERLAKASRRHNQQPGTPFTEAQAIVYRRQVHLTQDYLDKRLAGLTHEQATQAMQRSIRDAARVIGAYERQYTGIARALSLEDAAVMDEVVRSTGGALLRQHEASLARYSTRMVGEFERIMRAGLITAIPQHEVISRMVDAGAVQGIDAELLHEITPGSFPEPTGYMRKRYWAERIVRTETANAYNTMNLQSIEIARVNDFPDMRKKILATFDNRTAFDSIAVHGQVRKPDEMFRDGAGREYLKPPARPNDRETVVPWREGWAETDRTRPATQAEIEEARRSEKEGEDPALAIKRELEAAKLRVRKRVAADRARERAKKARTRATKRKASKLDMSDKLRRAKVLDQWGTASEAGANASWFMDLELPDGVRVRGVWKPASGEEDLRPNIKPGSFYRREAASYELDTMLGDPVVPPTVRFKHDGEIGSLQLFEENAEDIHAFSRKQGLSTSELFRDRRGGARRVALLDAITANDDRHDGNVLWKGTKQRPIAIAIDNGLGMPAGKSFFGMEISGTPIAQVPTEGLDFSGFAQEIEALELEDVAKLLKRHGIGVQAARGVLARARALQLNPSVLADTVAEVHNSVAKSTRLREWAFRGNLEEDELTNLEAILGRVYK